MHSYEDVVFEYVVDVLDGDVEIGSGSIEIYIPVDTIT